MKKYLLIVLIAFHLMGSNLYATKTFLVKDTIHHHKHSHSQTNITFTLLLQKQGTQ